MNIFNWFENRKAHKQAERESEAKRISTELGNLKTEAEKKLCAATSKMVSTYCPIRGYNCTEACVHFQAGKAGSWRFENYRWIDVYPEFNQIYRSPRCKLWKD